MRQCNPSLNFREEYGASVYIIESEINQARATAVFRTPKRLMEACCRFGRAEPHAKVDDANGNTRVIPPPATLADPLGLGYHLCPCLCRFCLRRPGTGRQYCRFNAAEPAVGWPLAADPGRFFDRGCRGWRPDSVGADFGLRHRESGRR